MTSQIFEYDLCGWRVRSELQLPELGPWRGDQAADAIVFCFGPVAELEDIAFETSWVQVGKGGQSVRMHVEGVCDYAIETGDRVVLSPRMRRDAPDIRLFLLGGAFGYLCQQRGVLPVHASVVEINGKAVLFAGQSGAGKSTLAAAFGKRGHRLLSDDVAPVQITEQSAMIFPSLARIRLWPDSALHAGWPIETLERCRDALTKVTRPIAAENVASSLEPQAIFHLAPARADGPDVQLKPIPGGRAVRALATRVYRARALSAIMGSPNSLKLVTEVANRIPQHFRLERRVDYWNLPATLDAILAALPPTR